VFYDLVSSKLLQDINNYIRHTIKRVVILTESIILKYVT